MTSVQGSDTTSAVGSVTVKETTGVAVTGVESSITVGTLAFTTNNTLNATGVSSTGSVGTVNAKSRIQFIPTLAGAYYGIGVYGTDRYGEVSAGIQAQSQITTVSVYLRTPVNVVGVNATAEAGTLNVQGNALISVSGVSATAEINNVTIVQNVRVNVSGVATTSALGSINVITTGFDYAAVAHLYSRDRLVYIPAVQSTTVELSNNPYRTIKIPASPKRIVYITDYPKTSVTVQRRSTSGDRKERVA